MKEILTHINGIVIYRNFVENLPFNPHLKVLTRAKRKAGILSEVLFWKQVRAKSFHGIDFDRQRIIGNYIVDFYVKTLGLVVEINDKSHGGKEVEDRLRDEYFESLGLKVFRVSDDAIKFRISEVLKNLEDFIIENYS